MSSGEHQPALGERAQSPELQEPTFDLSRFHPIEVEDLVVTLGEAAMRESEDDMRRRLVSPRDRRLATLGAKLDKDIRSFPDRDPDKAYELYMTLAKSDHHWPRAVASQSMGGLLERLPGDSDERQHAVDQWIALIHDEGGDGLVGEVTEGAMGDSLSRLDESTRQRLLRVLPDFGPQGDQFPDRLPE